MAAQILKDDTSLAQNNVTENGFLVVMVQKVWPSSPLMHDTCGRERLLAKDCSSV
jgi:hypothetical protein